MHVDQTPSLTQSPLGQQSPTLLPEFIHPPVPALPPFDGAVVEVAAGAELAASVAYSTQVEVTALDSGAAEEEATAASVQTDELAESVAEANELAAAELELANPVALATALAPACLILHVLPPEGPLFLTLRLLCASERTTLNSAASA